MQNNHPNYMYQLNAFDRWLDTHYLPSLSQLLWYRLTALFNRCGWPESAQIDTLRLTSMIGAGSEKAALTARDALAQAGLLTYEKGHKGCPNRYRLIWFSDAADSEESGRESGRETGSESHSESDRESHRKSDSASGSQNAGKQADINKQDIDIDKTRHKEKAAVPAALLDSLQQYEQMRRKSRKPVTAAAKKMLLDELERLAPGDTDKQRAILDRSTMHGWSGVFPLPEAKSRKEDADTAPASYDIGEMERRLLFGPIEYRKEGQGC